MTTPEQQPALHFWNSHPDPSSLTAKEIHEQGLDILDVMLPALEAVVENHLENGTPVVLEGDFMHPALAARERFGEEPNDGRVLGVWLCEFDEAQLVQNFLGREPETEPQELRACVSALRAAWIRDTCEDLGVPWVEPRPWETLNDRVREVIG